MALNAMLAEAHWRGRARGRRGDRDARHEARAGHRPARARARRAELDEDAGEIDTIDWFNQ